MYNNIYTMSFKEQYLDAKTQYCNCTDTSKCININNIILTPKIIEYIYKYKLDSESMDELKLRLSQFTVDDTSTTLNLYKFDDDISKVKKYSEDIYPVELEYSTETKKYNIINGRHRIVARIIYNIPVICTKIINEQTSKLSGIYILQKKHEHTKDLSDVDYFENLKRRKKSS